jgi:hypothetical protein
MTFRDRVRDSYEDRSPADLEAVEEDCLTPDLIDRLRATPRQVAPTLPGARRGRRVKLRSNVPSPDGPPTPPGHLPPRAMPETGEACTSGSTAPGAMPSARGSTTSIPATAGSIDSRSCSGASTTPTSSSWT